MCDLCCVILAVEARKADLSITNYSISQTSLEQIFIDFAKEGDDNLLAAEEAVRLGARREAAEACC